MQVFWFAVLGPKAQLAFIAACGLLLYAISR